MGGGGSAPSESPYGKELARVTREQWEHWKDVWQPVEMKMLNDFKGRDKTLQDDLGQAAQYTEQSFGIGEGITSRTMARYGGMSGEQTKEMKRIGQLQKSLGLAQGRNAVRFMSEKRNNVMEENLIGLGKMTASDSTQLLTSAYQQDQSRRNANAQQGSNGVLGLVGTVGGAVVGGVMGGPAGAMAGASVGGAAGNAADSWF